MKLLALLITVLFINVKAPEYLEAFHQAITKEQEEAFIIKYKRSNKTSVKAYVVSLKMKQAKYKFFPWKKLSVFNKGKKELEQLIKEHPENVDLRYVRLVIQENIPAILNYKSSITEDKEFLKRKLEEVDNSDYLDYYIKKNTSL
ncbi:hypothetical protein [Tenacibaculum sp. 190524A02b]|uniref:hypothetical protein n=1 Tax=Tenacibaculum vairaonense TaxID=3137860 RepID=UPI0031FB7534